MLSMFCKWIDSIYPEWWWGWGCGIIFIQILWLTESCHKCVVFPIFKQSKYNKIYVNTETLLKLCVIFLYIIWNASLCCIVGSSCFCLFDYYSSIINTMTIWAFSLFGFWISESLLYYKKAFCTCLLIVMFSFVVSEKAWTQTKTTLMEGTINLLTWMSASR